MRSSRPGWSGKSQLFACLEAVRSDEDVVGLSRLREMEKLALGNGSGYIAHEKRDVAAALSLRLALTPVCSPQSSGISKMFVKTLKRDLPSSHLANAAGTLVARKT
jgi:hypothetical protein